MIVYRYLIRPYLKAIGQYAFCKEPRFVSSFFTVGSRNYVGAVKSIDPNGVSLLKQIYSWKKPKSK